MSNKEVDSHRILKITNSTWSYIYKIDGKEKQILGFSENDLKTKVLDKGLPWDEDNRLEENVTSSKYDYYEDHEKSEKYSFDDIDEDTELYEASQSLPKWGPSRRKYHRGKHSIDDY